MHAQMVKGGVDATTLDTRSLVWTREPQHQTTCLHASPKQVTQRNADRHHKRPAKTACRLTRSSHDSRVSYVSQLDIPPCVFPSSPIPAFRTPLFSLLWGCRSCIISWGPPLSPAFLRVPAVARSVLSQSSVTFARCRASFRSAGTYRPPGPAPLEISEPGKGNEEKKLHHPRLGPFRRNSCRSYGSPPLKTVRASCVTSDV
ncbi:hypothetical protein EDB81DRAFT_62348 [Dactylonectria macrodidyma]|uniref:Uncharacterized protein n=1 Tax=Dactylonectria macrodidyma TaxID=307937 RepID=A0A9P9EJJ8_9HYPO|nr:hypothetical protein EDB81DRAFT_62348 [Dactylonectria macrodidyma]